MGETARAGKQGRTSTRGEFWKKHPLAYWRKKAKPFPGGDRYVVKGLSDEESKVFWASLERV